MKYQKRIGWLIPWVIALAGCGGGGGGGSSNPNAEPGTAVPTAPTLSATAALGEKIFQDKSLSASGQQSCTTCHDPRNAHSGSDINAPVPFGGVHFGAQGLEIQGFRNAPSLNYLSFTPAFFFDSEGTPTGGFDRDGRADTFSAQARRPFLADHEMANETPAAVVEKLRSASYVNEFTQLFGSDIFDKGDAAFDRALLALEQYEKESPEFRPFDSKFDYFLVGKATLTEQELRGYALYNNPAKGNCAGCHPSARAADGTPPLFTDFTYDNLGVPRNTDIGANADPAYYDLGLCGPDRTDLVDAHPDLCGAFKVPSLRNVAITAPYFHNGKFATLREVVAFYVRRDTNPEEWYPNNGADKFNDLPPEFHRNVNITEVPYNRHLGDQPALSSDEIDAVVAFLNTLTDGYQPLID